MSEQRELIDIADKAIQLALSDMHTICIAVVTAVNEKTVSCRPTINRVVKGQDVQLPEFVEVPPVFMRGGSSYTAHPIAVGDYCLVLVTERCLDRWWIGQDFQRPLEMRMHDYSDGFALVGIGNLAGLITIPDVITQIGDTYQEGNYEHIGDMLHTGNTAHEGDTEQTGEYNLDGDAAISGNTDSGTYSTGGTAGVSGTFISKDDKTITVTNGLITGIA
jgi:hypothetical protein